MTSEAILSMIESVDPRDTAALDEIDARVQSLIYGTPFLGMSETGSGFIYCRGKSYGYVDIEKQYTRSRDALKAIRPEGWFLRHGIILNNAYSAMLYGPSTIVSSPCLPTEELAELHAIIQAIEYERKQA